MNLFNSNSKFSQRISQQLAAGRFKHNPENINFLRQRMEADTVVYTEGIIVSVIEDGANNILAVIARTEEHGHGDDEDTGNGNAYSHIFNNYLPLGVLTKDGKNVEIPLGPLLIRIVNPVQFPPNGLEYYSGKKVIVKLVKGIAKTAELVPEDIIMSDREMLLYRRLIEQAYIQTGDIDLKTLDLEFFRYTGKRLTDLGVLPIDPDLRSPLHPVLVFEDHANSDAITKASNIADRVIIKTNEFLKGNDKAKKLKTALCHQPAKFFTGK